nr:hypothetical protein [Tanacetum cinerariifolium]
DLNEPANYKAALLDLEFDKWLKAMNVEMQSMKDNKVWDLVDLPPNDIRAIMILITISTFYDYEIWQMDVKTVFLNVYLSKEVYMEQPEGFVNPRFPNQDVESYLGRYFAMNDLGEANPGKLHWTAVKNILKYLRNTKDMFLVYADRIWVRKFIDGLGVVPIKMYCDNIGAITIANESGITKGARHYRAKVYYLREVIEYGDVKLEKVHTNDNLADPFTKSLVFPKHSEHTKNIGMLPASNIM